ncbi:rna-directed dna polymerase from mobile element jockey-like [Pitangus sulphuratus]|nr:rna-directed dna polymerase from mobile element jockey-like [Pitangus sulphuratus]
MPSTKLDKHIMWWVSSWLMGRAQRVTVNGGTSDWRPVTNGDPQGSILDPVLFNIFINDLDAELGGTVDSLKGREALQRDLSKLDNWAITNHMKFNRGKCWTAAPGTGSPGCKYSLGNEMLKSSATERDLWVLVDNKLNTSQQCPGSQEHQPCPQRHQGGKIKNSQSYIPPKQDLGLEISELFGFCQMDSVSVPSVFGLPEGERNDRITAYHGNLESFERNNLPEYPYSDGGDRF